MPANSSPEYMREYRRVNRHRMLGQTRCADMKRRYGITCEQYEELLHRQGGTCAICEGTNPGGKRVAIDHDHETGQVRGLLCSSCNTGLGHFRDSAELLDAAITYLIRREEIAR